MSGEEGETTLSREVEERIKTAVEERVTKELAQVVSSLKDAAQGPGGSVNTTGGGKWYCSPERDDESSSDTHLTILWCTGGRAGQGRKGRRRPFERLRKGRTVVGGPRKGRAVKREGGR